MEQAPLNFFSPPVALRRVWRRFASLGLVLASLLLLSGLMSEGLVEIASMR
jgi:putative copper export protein